jgi:ABC-type transport system substrate-binding protein
VLRFVSGPAADAFGIELEGDLAESWQEAPDGMMTTFKLHSGVKWQNVAPLNGRPFTAADVKYTWERYAASGAQSVYFQAVDRIEATDDQTVVVRMKQPSADFLTPIASRYLLIHPRELVENGTIEHQAVGTGPLILKEALASQRVVLERNPDYFRGPIHLDGVEHRVMTDANARTSAFRVGQIGHAQSITGTLRELESLEGAVEGLQIVMTPATNTYFAISFNLNDPRFTDERVRRAMSMAMDREAIVQVVYQGAGASLPSIPWLYVADEQPAYSDPIYGPYWQYNAEEAMKMLQAAGAESLEFDLRYYNYSDVGNSLPNQQIVDQFRRVGITMHPVATDYNEFNSQWTTGKNEVAMDGWLANGFTADNFFYNTLHSSAPGNRYTIKDAQIDQWAEEQSRELDPEARREIHRKIWDRVQDQQWRVDKPYNNGFDVLQPWVRGISFTGPLLINYSFTEITASAQMERAWLDK